MSDQVIMIPDEINYFRRALALVQITYYLSLLGRLSVFFGAHGWVKMSYWSDVTTILAISESNSWRWLLLGVMFCLLIMLYKGTLNRFGLLVYYLINLSFYVWNPFIIHEPQPIINLFFLSFFFLPMNNKHSYDSWIKNILIIFLGIYYFLAGIKKLPDPNFIYGTALESIISWTAMAKNLSFNLYLVKHFLWIIRLMNYLTLVFEITFIFFVFTRFRIYLILFGLLLHSLIYMTLEVGNFSFVMMIWYIL